MNKQLVRLLVIFVAVLIGSGLLVYVLLERTRTPATNADRPAATENIGAATPGTSPSASGSPSILKELFGIDTPDETRGDPRIGSRSRVCKVSALSVPRDATGFPLATRRFDHKA